MHSETLMENGFLNLVKVHCKKQCIDHNETIRIPKGSIRQYGHTAEVVVHRYSEARFSASTSTVIAFGTFVSSCINLPRSFSTIFI